VATRRKLLFLSAVIAAAFSSHALAQTADDEKCIGARARPACEDADSSRVDGMPYLRLYGEHFFARNTQDMLERGWRTRPIGGLVFGT
jgi:hypothetical protein